MFVRQTQQQFRNASADVQIFYGDANTNNNFRGRKTWNKPPGVSHVYMLLIGGGGTGDGSSGSGGGSGAVTVWYGAAQTVPDCLEILVTTAGGGVDTYVSYRSTSATVVDLLRANTTGNTSGASSTAAGVFAASGFYQSVAGQNGTFGARSASTTTFLSGGTDGSNTITANYGYSTTYQGFFQLQPIIVGLGANDAVGGTKMSGIGCGGSATGSYPGGQGMALIASW